jgi:hypothetical protein
METTQAKELIRDIFQNRFRREHYQLFLRNLLNDIELRDKHYLGNLIPPAFKEQVSQYWRIGKYVDPDGHEMDLLVVELTTLSKLDHARSMLRSFAVNRLKTFNKECSLIAFYSREDNGADWRFSYVKIEHQAFKDHNGKVKIKDEFTPARRCSYLVGEHENSYTAARQLLPLLERDFANPRLADIEAAFSIEKVTDEFFEQYKNLYLKLSVHLKGQPLFQHLSGEEQAHHIARFAKKLLGQIVFLYFLQKKGWLGVAKDERWGAGSRRFMRDRFGIVADEEKNYYRDFLQYLFYEALAKERKNQADPGYYSRFDCKIPFLNGGLFEADYDWQKETIDLPNTLFHNNEKNKGGDEGTGILDVFDRYNFTIKEDEPLEKEVAVDPEMLGKVFENMLDVTERKSKGAFYTPREIVHYMCQESLIHYLDNVLNTTLAAYHEMGSTQVSLFGNDDRAGQLSLIEESQDSEVPKEDIETLIRKGYLFVDHDKVAFQREERVKKGEQKGTAITHKLPESVRKKAKLIDDKLAAIRACDPAIGSGAFPVGLLHEIVTARLALAEHLEHPQTAYALKRHTIRESLYGVDIDQSAIDIARLRLWLSLIVDEEDYNTIEALPNLDYKIVRGNSLIGFPDNLFRDVKEYEEIEILKQEFYEETDEGKRRELRERITSRLHTFLDSAQKFSQYHDIDFDFELFFSEVWHKQGGFDVVIGNPPYRQIQEYSGQSIQKSWEKQYASTFAKTGDIYCLFYEKGFRLLRKNGVLAFITSNKWMRANYGEKLRKFFVQQTNPLVLIDFSGFQVFTTATVDANILIAEKAKNRKQLIASSVDKEFTHYTNIERFVEEQHITLDDLSEKSWSISKKTEYRIRQRIEKVGTPLKEWDISINRGILTGYNDAFIIDGKKKDELIGLDPKSAEIIKPILRGRDIKRYRVEFADYWLIATLPALHIDINNFSAVHDHLASFGNKLHQTGEVIGKDDGGQNIFSRKKTGNKWFETQDPIAYHKDFAKQKIVWGNLALKAQFALADPGIFLNAPSNMITDGGLYLLAVLNSGIGDYYIRSLGVTRNGGYFEYKPMFVEKLPVPQLPLEEQEVYIQLANYVLILTKYELKLQSAFFEQLIDALVYELYFPDELKVAGKEILHHLGELKPITEMITDAEKLSIIQSEFDRLYDPNHPVRNNLETLDSVEEVRIIREALKR